VFSSGAHLLGKLERAKSLDTTLTEFHYDPTTDELVVRESQDVEPILDYCAERRVHDPNGRVRIRGMGRYVCELPNVIVARWMREPSRNYPKGWNAITGRCMCWTRCSCPNDKRSASDELRRRLADYDKLLTSSKPRDRVGAGWGLP